MIQTVPIVIEDPVVAAVKRILPGNHFLCKIPESLKSACQDGEYSEEAGNKRSPCTSTIYCDAASTTITPGGVSTTQPVLEKSSSPSVWSSPSSSQPMPVRLSSQQPSPTSSTVSARANAFTTSPTQQTRTILTTSTTAMTSLSFKSTSIPPAAISTTEPFVKKSSSPTPKSLPLSSRPMPFRLSSQRPSPTSSLVSARANAFTASPNQQTTAIVTYRPTSNTTMMSLPSKSSSMTSLSSTSLLTSPRSETSARTTTDLMSTCTGSVASQYTENPTFHTGPDYHYQYSLPQVPKDNALNLRVSFAVKAESDVRIVLAETQIHKSLEGGYVIVIGGVDGYGIPYSAIRSCLAACMKTRVNSNPLSVSEMRPFVITYDNGLIEVFAGEESTPFLSYQDTSPKRISFVGFTTNDGSSGEFVFNVCDMY